MILDEQEHMELTGRTGKRKPSDADRMVDAIGALAASMKESVSEPAPPRSYSFKVIRDGSGKIHEIIATPLPN